MDPEYNPLEKMMEDLAHDIQGKLSQIVEAARPEMAAKIRTVLERNQVTVGPQHRCDDQALGFLAAEIAENVLSMPDMGFPTEEL